MQSTQAYMLFYVRRGMTYDLQAVLDNLKMSASSSVATLDPTNIDLPSANFDISVPPLVVPDAVAEIGVENVSMVGEKGEEDVDMFSDSDNAEKI